MSVASLIRRLKVTFMNEGSLEQMPSLVSENPKERCVEIPEYGLDEDQTAEWMRQAAESPEWERYWARG